MEVELRNAVRTFSVVSLGFFLGSIAVGFAIAERSGLDFMNLANNLTCEVKTGIHVINAKRYVYDRNGGPWRTPFYAEGCFYQRYGDTVHFDQWSVQFTLFGDSVRNSTVEKPQRVGVALLDLSAGTFPLSPILRGRLIGPSIVAIHLVPLNRTAWEGRFLLFETGQYHLEIFLSWLDDNPAAASVPYIGQLLFRVPHEARFDQKTRQRSMPAPLPLCTPELYASSSARWLRLELLQCMNSCGLRSLLTYIFSSIGRCIVFDFIDLLETLLPEQSRGRCTLSSCSGARKISLDAKKLKKTVAEIHHAAKTRKRSWKGRKVVGDMATQEGYQFPVLGKAATFQIFLEPTSSIRKADLLFLEPGAIPASTEGGASRLNIMDKLLTSCIKMLPPGRCIVMLNSVVHREDWRVRAASMFPDGRYNAIQKALRSVRDDTVTKSVKIIKEKLTTLARNHGNHSFITLDLYSMTEARWDATWDGMHYQLYWPSGPTRDWYGGVCRMATMLFLNLLCNPCVAKNTSGR
eukprot:RCo044364